MRRRLEAEVRVSSSAVHNCGSAAAKRSRRHCLSRERELSWQGALVGTQGVPLRVRERYSDGRAAPRTPSPPSPSRQGSRSQSRPPIPLQRTAPRSTARPYPTCHGTSLRHRQRQRHQQRHNLIHGTSADKARGSARGAVRGGHQPRMSVWFDSITCACRRAGGVHRSPRLVREGRTTRYRWTGPSVRVCACVCACVCECV